jgi:preprotein translocase subunit YajC
MRVGDYVMTAHRIVGSFVTRKGVRGTVVSVGKGWAEVKTASGTRFTARKEQLIRLVPAADHKQEAFVGRGN